MFPNFAAYKMHYCRNSLHMPIKRDKFAEIRLAMITFLLSILLLVAGYFIYGKFVDRLLGSDPSRKTPAYELQDGIDYQPMPTWRVFVIQFLNIAGLGPIFGAIMGAAYGPAAYLWIVLG